MKILSYQLQYQLRYVFSTVVSLSIIHCNDRVKKKVKSKWLGNMMCVYGRPDFI